MPDFTEILDENATATALADFSEFGRVTEAGTEPTNAIRDLNTFMAASTAGLSIDTTKFPREEVGRHILQAAITRQSTAASTNAGVIDPIILGQMTLSEYYTLAHGDLWQFALVPLQMGFHEDFMLSGDEGAVREAREFLDMIQMSKRIEEAWLARFVYGNGYLVTLTDGKDVTGIITANSKHIAIKKQVGIGPRTYAYAPSPEVINEISHMTSKPSFIYRPISADWNEAIIADPAAFEIKPEDITHISVPKMANHVYGIPPFARAMTDIDSRTDLEEMAQATIKGYRSQLWLFLIEKAKKGEAAALRSALSTDARTGVLVWGSNLELQQHAPKTLDELLGNEAYWRFTMAVYRAIGVTPRVVAGESPNLRSSTGDSETDISVYLDKLMYDRTPFRDFVQSTLKRQFGPKAAKVDFPDIELRIADRIKTMLVPLMNYGLPSLRTAFQRAGLDPDSEMKQHEQDWDFRQKYMHPYTGFSQAGPSGVTDSPGGGRPPGSVETKPREEKAQASTREEYEARVASEWARVEGNQEPAQVRAFALRLFSLGAIYREKAYYEGYGAAGGRRGVDRQRVDDTIVWDEEYMRAFEDELIAGCGGDDKKDLKVYRWRAMLYPAMGFKMAFVAGVFQARMEQGYTGWQRILNPSASRSGPCEICVSDARTVHPIEEPFFDHPHGVCGMRLLRFYKGSIPGGTIAVPFIAVEERLG